MFNNIYFLDIGIEPIAWIPYINKMVSPETPFKGDKDYMRYKFVGWTDVGILCIAPLMLGRTLLDHTKIISLAEEANFIAKNAIDDVWGKIGASGAIMSWKSLRGTTDTSLRIQTAKYLSLPVMLSQKASPR